MKKRILIALCLVIVVVMAALTLTACNPFKQDAISGGDSKATVYSNGGFAVRQGSWLYFVNGYDADAKTNEFGAVLKNSICRVKLNEDGTVGTNAVKCVVPKQVYWTNKESGFAVYGNWIYYATPNNDRDRNGAASTTNLDFMRTSLDGTVTQLIFTANSRSLQYWFMPTRIVVYNNSNLTAIDFTALQETKSISKVSKKVTTSQIATNVTSVVFKQDAEWSASQGKSMSDYVFYTKTVTGTEAYKNYNELYMIKYDGSGKKLLAGDKAFGETNYKLTLNGGVLEGDSQMTLVYVKQHVEGTATKTDGLYMNKVGLDGSFDKANEKCLTTSITSTTVTNYPVSYEKGALVTSGDEIYLLDGTKSGEAVFSEDAKVVGKASMSIRYVAKNTDGNYYAYYGATSSIPTLFRINLLPNEGASPNEDVVLEEKFGTSWIEFDFITVGNDTFVYFFDTNDYNYVHGYKLSAYNGEKGKTELIAKMTSADKKSKDAASK